MILTHLTGETDERGKVKAKTYHPRPRRDITLEDWENHFSGKVGLGVSPLLLSNSCKWAAIDVDIYPYNVEEFSRKYKHLPAVFCRTKSGGLHIYFFFKRNKKAKDVILFLKQVALLFGFIDYEWFPAQEKSPAEGEPNCINLPYFNKYDTNRYAIYDGNVLDYTSFIAHIQKNIIIDFNEVLKHFVLSEAPPCVQKMHAQGIMEGSRDVSLLNTAIFLKQKYPNDWIKKLYKLNYSLDEPLPDKELEQSVISQVQNKDVFFTCGKLKDVCQRDVCLTRKYGIGSASSVEKILGELKKITTDPPVWVMVVDGQEIQLSTEKLLNFNAFRMKVLETTNKLIARIKVNDWEAILAEKCDPANLVIIEAPEDAGQHSDFYSCLKEFCLKRCNTRSRDDVTDDKVHIENGRNYFRIEALVRYLKNRVRYNYKNNDIYPLIRGIGGDGDYQAIKGKSTRLWYVPTYKEQEQHEEKRKVPEWAEEGGY
jgi:hypothetical protein